MLLIKQRDQKLTLQEFISGMIEKTKENISKRAMLSEQLHMKSYNLTN